MKTIQNLTDHQWKRFAASIDAWLHDCESTGQPLELCHQFIQRLLGYPWEVDFYDALLRYHATAQPRPSFHMQVVNPGGPVAGTIVRLWLDPAMARADARQQPGNQRTAFRPNIPAASAGLRALRWP